MYHLKMVYNVKRHIQQAVSETNSSHPKNEAIMAQCLASVKTRTRTHTMPVIQNYIDKNQSMTIPIMKTGG